MIRVSVKFAIALLLLLGAVLFSMSLGSIKVPFTELLSGLAFGGSEEVEVIKDLRLPRIIVSLFTGAALAVAGVLLQAVMRNPLADSGVVGISSGAGLVSVLMVTLFPAMFFWMPLFAFAGGALACFLVYAFSWRSGLSPLRLILVGVAVNATFTGLGQSFNYRGSYAVTTVNQATTSIFTLKTWNDVHMIVIYGSIGLILSLLLASSCNLLALTDKTARNLGLSVTRSRLFISATAVLLAATATAIGGLIVFVGLLIPPIAKAIIGSDHKYLIPFSAIAGALLILAADTLGRTLLAPTEIPASIIMTVIGGPFLIFLLRRSGQVRGD